MQIDRYALFLSLGLTRVYPHRQRLLANVTREKLVEPQGSRNCRRNIVVLSGVLVVAGFAGVDPQDLRVFGVRPSGGWGVLVLGAAAILTQVYWYILRFHHLNEDGVIQQLPYPPDEGPQDVPIDREHSRIVWRTADLLANQLAFVMTTLSWVFIGIWVAGCRFTIAKDCICSDLV